MAWGLAQRVFWILIKKFSREGAEQCPNNMAKKSLTKSFY